MLNGDIIKETVLDLETVYLEYVNDFITIDSMSRYYGIDAIVLEKLIKIGRELNHMDKMHE